MTKVSSFFLPATPALLAWSLRDNTRHGSRGYIGACMPGFQRVPPTREWTRPRSMRRPEDSIVIKRVVQCSVVQ